MDNRPIGVFDSGLGGLTVVRRLLSALPSEDIVYFGDTGRMPYGTRSEETVRRYTAEDCRFLRRFDCKLIIAACGTASSVAEKVLASLPEPTIGVVDPAVKAAAEATRAGNIGVIATDATVSTGVFPRKLRALLPSCRVTSLACPLFVTLVESGWISPSDEVTQAVAARYLEGFAGQSIDTLILGCTHFPLLKPLLADRLGKGVALIDPGREAAAAAKSLLEQRGLLHDGGRRGTCRYYVSDRPQDFARIAGMFLGREITSDLRTVDPADLS